MKKLLAAGSILLAGVATALAPAPAFAQTADLGPLAATITPGSPVVGSSTPTPIAVSGGLAPYRMSLGNGTMPPGRSVSARSQALVGTYLRQGGFGYNVRVTDALGAIVDVPVQEYVTGGLSISLPSPTETVGSTDKFGPTVAGGIGPYTIDLAGGQLPSGRSLSSSGVLVGTYSGAGQFTYTLRATDAAGERREVAVTEKVTVPSAATLPTWRAAVARVKAGTGRGRILMIGDSTTLSEGGGNDASSPYDTGAVGNSAGYVMAAGLAAGGIPTNANGFWGDGGCANYGDVAYSVFSQQFYPGGTAAAFPRSQGNQTVGGGVWNIASSTAGKTGGYFTFNPGMNNTKIRLFLINSQYGYGTFGVQVDSGTANPVTVPQQPAGTDLAYTLDVPTGTRGLHSVSMNRTNTGNGTLYVLGGYAFDETTPAIDVMVAGNRGSGIGNWIIPTNSGTGWDNYGFLATLAPDLTLIVPPINDAGAVTDIGTFTNNLDALVKRMKSLGSDVVIVNAGDTNPASNNQNLRPQYTAAMKTVAANDNVPFADMQAIYAWNATDWRDALHPRKVQYAREGQYLASFLMGYAQ